MGRILRKISGLFGKASSEENAPMADAVQDSSSKGESRAQERKEDPSYYNFRAKIESYMASFDPPNVIRTLFEYDLILQLLISNIVDGFDRVAVAFEVRSTKSDLQINDIDVPETYSLISPFIDLKTYAEHKADYINTDTLSSAVFASVVLKDDSFMYLLLHMQPMIEFDNENNPCVFIKLVISYIDADANVLGMRTMAYSIDATDQSDIIVHLGRKRVDGMLSEMNGNALTNSQKCALNIVDVKEEVRLGMKAFAENKLDLALRHGYKAYRQLHKKFRTLDRDQRQLYYEANYLIALAYVHKGLPYLAQFYLDVASSLPDVENQPAKDLNAICSQLTHGFSLEEGVDADEDILFPSKVGLAIKNVYELNEDDIAQACMIKENLIISTIPVKGMKGRMRGKALTYDYLDDAREDGVSIVALRTKEGCLHLAVIGEDMAGYQNMGMMRIAHIDHLAVDDEYINFSFFTDVYITEDEFLSMRSRASEKVLEESPLSSDELDTLGAHMQMHYNYIQGRKACEAEKYGDAVYYLEKAYKLFSMMRIDTIDDFDMHMLGKVCVKLGTVYQQVNKLLISYKLFSHLAESDIVQDRMMYMTIMMVLGSPQAYPLLLSELKGWEDREEDIEDAFEFEGFFWEFLRDALSRELEAMGRITEAKEMLHPLLASPNFVYRQEACKRMQYLIDRYPE